jgi:hypothetical protein
VTVLAEDTTHTIGTIETTEGIETIEVARGGRSLLLSPSSAYSYDSNKVSECVGVGWTVDSSLIQGTPTAVWHGMLLIVNDLTIYSNRSVLMELAVAILGLLLDYLAVHAFVQELVGSIGRGGQCGTIQRRGIA